jgi:thymidylate synthase
LQNTIEFLKYYKLLYQKLLSEEYVIDKSGVKMVELLAPKFELDSNEQIIDIGIRKSNETYLNDEKIWYLSTDLNINKIDHVKIWKECADKNNEINSNYGYLVFGRGNFNQFDHCLNALIKHNESRQAIIIYNRPSMHYESTSFNCKDFVCTMFQQFFIRNHKLECITSMRSNDCIFGTFNDIPWFHYVIKKMQEELYNNNIIVELGKHIFIPNSWHCYERHFDILRKIGESCE